MGETTWLFVLVGIAIGFPIIITQINGYFDNSPDEFEVEEIPTFSNAPISFILNSLGITDFVDAMSNIPQPMRTALYLLWIITLIYILVKALPFT
jgi:hypothetical protein